jgi:hypothetical protein
MSNRLQPSRLRDYAEYHAALRELEELFLCDPDSPAGRRFDQLVGMIDEFDCRTGNAMPGANENCDRPSELSRTRDPLSGLPTINDPECDLAREATIRR